MHVRVGGVVRVPRNHLNPLLLGTFRGQCIEVLVASVGELHLACVNQTTHVGRVVENQVEVACFVLALASTRQAYIFAGTLNRLDAVGLLGNTKKTKLTFK